MFPEGFIVAVHILPVLAHIVQEVGSVLRLQDRSDVAVFAGLVAELLVAAVAVIGPGAVSLETDWMGEKNEYQSP